MMGYNQHTPLTERFANSYLGEPNSGCWLWMGSTRVDPKSDDIRPIIYDGGKPLSAYRLSFELAVGPIPAGAFICHKCDVSICVNPAHLYVGNAKNNAQDTVERRRHYAHKRPQEAAERGRVLGKSNTWSRGRPYRNAIIPHADVPIIEQRLADGVMLKQIASEYGVSGQAIRKFVKRWSKKIDAALKQAEQP